jgi:hypothetical protein
VRKIGDDAIENIAQLGAEQVDVGWSPSIGHFFGGLEFVERKLVSRRENALAALHEADVPGDAENPGPHMLGLAKLAEVFEDLEQRFLRDLFGVLRLAAHEPTIVEHLGSEMADESLEGFGLAGDKGARKFGLAWLVHATIVT